MKAMPAGTPALPGLACSPGAACHSDRVSVSHVLEAMNVSVDYAMGAIRFSLGYETGEADIREAIVAALVRL